MKPAEIRELSDAQLVEKLKEMRAELFNLVSRWPPASWTTPLASTP